MLQKFLKQWKNSYYWQQIAAFLLITHFRFRTNKKSIPLSGMLFKTVRTRLELVISSVTGMRPKPTRPTDQQLRGLDLNQRPPGYEPDELPDCSTPR